MHSTHTLFIGVRRRFYCSAERKKFLFAPANFPTRIRQQNSLHFWKHSIVMQTLFLHVAKAVFAVCKNYFYRLQKPFLQRLQRFQRLLSCQGK